MRQIIKFPGVSVNNPALQQINVSSNDKRLAALPDIKLWLQPGFMQPSGSYMERANGKLLTPNGTGTNQNAWTASTFANGAAAIAFNPAGSKTYSPPDDTQMNATAWTVAMVMKGPTSTASPDEILTSPYAAGTATAMRIGLNTSRTFRVWDGSTAVRAEYAAPAVYCDAVALMMVTFSMAEGLRIFANGTKVVENAADKNPLTLTKFHLGAMSNVYTAPTNAFSGLLGHVMIFDRDLSLSANAAYKAELETVLKSIYGIAP